MTITIQEITDQQQWDSFLARQSRPHFFQSFEWGELNIYLGGKIYRLGAVAEGQLVGIMLLVMNPVPLLSAIPGVRFNWLYCSRGPIVERPDSPALPALIEYAYKLARREHSVLLRVEPNIADDDPNMEQWIAAYHNVGFHSNPISVHIRRSWVLDIRPSAEQLLADFKMTWRQNVRSAERKGVVIREATTDADFDAYYDLLKITSERDDFFIHSPDYHKEILRRFRSKGDAVLYLAEHEGEAIAAKVLLRVGDWCWDVFGASSNHKRNLKATYLLQYRCFLWAKEKGCSFFDFRTIPEILEPGEEMWGVYEYKRGFGGFSRLNMPTQDYVYRPLIYTVWQKVVEIRRERRHKERQRVELERQARGKKDDAAQQAGEAAGASQKARPARSVSTADRMEQEAQTPQASSETSRPEQEVEAGKSK